MRKTTKAILAIFTLLFISCDDILEEDISDDTIDIITPTDNSFIEGSAVQFNWNDLDGADEYSIQVTDEVNIIILDTTVTSTVFRYDFEEDSYFWRIKGSNFAYETEYSTPSQFTIVPVSNFEDIELSLSNPIDDFKTNDLNSFRFSWNAISTAVSYDFEILEAESNRIIFSEKLTVSEITLDMGTSIEDGSYIWQVRASNGVSLSNFSQRNFILDTEAPSSPALITPASNEELNNNEEITFSWEFPENDDSLTDIISILEIASDSDFDTIIHEELDINTTELQYTPSTTGTFYWRVFGTDAVGNEGVINDSGEFTIN